MRREGIQHFLVSASVQYRMALTKLGTLVPAKRPNAAVTESSAGSARIRGTAFSHYHSPAEMADPP